MYSILKIFNKTTFLLLLLSFVLVNEPQAQAIRKTFTPRTSVKAPAPFTGEKSYTVKGDFVMLGNTNLTLDSYKDDRNNSNYKMKFVDIDSDNNTRNSSSAELKIDKWDKDCHRIVYAGLYWTGRAENATTGSSNDVNGFKKREVKFKHQSGRYETITAKETDILFPGANSMYAAYADVTDKVIQYGVGNYFVADIATTAGVSDATGYYGGWGMVVIYENNDMKWRDITVFDGYAYMVGNGNHVEDLVVSGFKAAEKGNVGVKLGMMAGEGDVGVEGDYFQIKRGNSYDNLTHSGNKEKNFFNSSIHTGGNDRNPNRKNNTGLDISTFDLENTNNRYIANGATSTTLRYGSTQDTYIIFNIVIAIDAFVPEIEGHNQLLTTTVTDGGTVKPNDLLDFELKIYNKGTDAVKDGKIEIPIPPNAHYVSAVPTGLGGTVQWVHPNSNDPSKTPGGKIVWTLGQEDIPTSLTNLNKVLASLKYTLRITSDCNLLTASSGGCGLEVPVNGTITGKGQNSGREVLEGLIKDYTNDKCKGPDYGGFLATIEVSDQFIDGCPFEVEDGARLFLPFCELPYNKLSREEVVSQYPAGTVFYTIPPGQPGHAGSVVEGNFEVSVEGKTYYAVVVGMQEGCFLKIKLRLDVVTSQPTVETSDFNFCFNEEVVLSRIKLSAEGEAKGHTIHYFDASEELMSEAPAATAVGKYIYYAAEGKVRDGVWCYGPKVKFTITILDLPKLPADIEDFYVCIDEGKTVVVNEAGIGNEIQGWQYEKDGEWHDLLESSFQGMLKGAGNTLTVADADDEVLDQLKVRAVIYNGKCTGYSEAATIEVRYCTIPVNPMIRSKTNKTI